MFSNLTLLTDSYKFSHYKQYPPNTQTVYSYFESRGGPYSTTFFGLQYILKQYLEGVVISHEVITQAKQLVDAHMGPGLFNEEGWRYIVDTHGGRLPVRIKAVPEGTTHSPHKVLMTVENTDPKCFWLTNYLETLLVQVWYPSTVCSQSREMKSELKRFHRMTSDLPEDGVDFQLHDFGFRGSTSVESSAIGGAAHLVNFKGTDTFSAIELLHDYYGAPMAGFSIPAAEHSTTTSWGEDHEVDAYRNMLEQYPEGLVAVVSDSYNIFNACSDVWGGMLKDLVVNRKGKLIIRPDSGDPVETIVKVFEILGEKFGYTLNEKRFMMLPPYLGVIQGDGINPKTMHEILQRLWIEGWSSSNIAFGSGGALLQKVNRDTLKFAFKCSAIQVDGEWRNVYKNPVGDPGKRSKTGRFTDVDLRTVFEDGVLLVDDTLETIRERAAL